MRRLVANSPDKEETEDVMLAFGGKLKAARATAGFSQEALAVRSFLRRKQMWAFESGRRAPDILDLLTLADRLRVPAAGLIDGLKAPVRRVATMQVLDAITQHPGIKQDALTTLLELPHWYVGELTLYLQSIGAIGLGGGWHVLELSDGCHNPQ